MNHRRRLRERLAQPEILVLPGAPDAITARVIEEAGFDAVYVTGAGFSNGSFGLPDIGLLSVTDVTQNVQRIADVVNLPIVVDADTGYGGVLNVHRTVRHLEHAGAAAIQIEDQQTPKRCGHFDGNSVIARHEMVQKVHAALDARNDPDLLIIARTDAYQTEGLNSAIDRAGAYAEAGADIIFVEAPSTIEDLRRLPRLVDAPLLANMVEGGKTPPLSAAELEQLGFRIALFANTALRASIRATQAAMEVLKRDGTTTNILDDIVTWDQRQDLLRLPELQALEDRFLNVAGPPPQRTKVTRS